MRNFKIFQLISSFSDIEWKEFKVFAKSSYFTGSREYGSILFELNNFRINRNEFLKITTEEFFAKIFPGKKYNNKTLRNRLNELTKIGEKYLSQKIIEEDELQSKLLLLKGYKRKKLTNLFINEYDKISSTINIYDSKSYNVSELKLLSADMHRERQDFGKMLDEFKKHTDYLLVFFLEKFYDSMIEYESEKNYGINPSVNIADDIERNLNSEKLIKVMEERNDPAYIHVILNYFLYKSFVHLHDDSIIDKFQKIFFNNLDNLSYEKKNEIFSNMISRLFLKVNAGKPEYLKDVFRLYNIKLKLGLYSELKFIRYPANAFRDYIVVGLRLKRYKWVEEFIKKYSCELPEEIRKDEVNMAYARLYFFKGEYQNTIEMLTRGKSSNYLFNLDVSRLKLRIYYEISEFDEAFLEIDRLKHYMKNNIKRIARTVRQYNKEFLDFYNMLLKIKLSPDKNELSYVKQKISESKTLVTKVWFTEKISEMKN